MRIPFDGNPPITSPFGVRRTYTNTKGQTITDIHNGVDYGVAYGTPVKAPEAGQAIMMWDPYGGGNMVVIDGAHGRHVLLHNSRYNGNNRRVSEGEIVAFVGNTGNVTGTHSHWGLKRNGVWVNPLQFLNSSSYNKNMKTVTVQPGWGLSHVAQSAGLPTTEATYQEIYNLNSGHRGSKNWQELNARMGPGDVLKVSKEDEPAPKPAQKPNVNIEKLKQDHIREINALKSGYEAKIEELKSNVADLIIEQEESKAQELERAKTINQLLSEIDNLKEEAKIKFAIDVEELGITGSEKEIIQEARKNIIKQSFILLSSLFDRVPRPVRPLVYLGSGLGLTLIATFLSGLDLTQFASNDPDSVLAIGIGFVTTTGLMNQLVYLLKQLGDRFREEAVSQQSSLI